MEPLMKAFNDYLFNRYPSTTGTAPAYIRAMRYMRPILEEQIKIHSLGPSLYELDVESLRFLRNYIGEQRKLPGGGTFSIIKSKSYLEKNYCTSVLSALIEFTVLREREGKLLDIIRNLGTPSEIGNAFKDLPFSDTQIFLEKIEGFRAVQGKDIIREAKFRQNQDIFRRMILMIYDHRCCLTGIPVETVLRASHIMPWAESKAERMNPTNGLCLSATYDAAFDRHFISFDDDYRMVLAPALGKYVGDQAYEEAFVSLKGHQLVLPKMEQYAPSMEFLRCHRKLLVAK